jgi:hypothetical protein
MLHCTLPTARSALYQPPVGQLHTILCSMYDPARVQSPHTIRAVCLTEDICSCEGVTARMVPTPRVGHIKP